MAAPAKKRDLEKPSKNGNESHMSDDSSDENMEQDNVQPEEKITVDFVGRIPDDSDYHGIKSLLQQLFLKGHISLGDLANYIISHNYVGSVVKQECDDEDDDDEEDDEAVKDVYGVTCVVNISRGQTDTCVQQLRTLLEDLSSTHAPPAINEKIKDILQNDSTALGLIINERFVNIPAQISVPLLENLVNDMKKATKKKMPYEFQYFILISKLYRTNDDKKTSSKMTEDSKVFWSNQEEEVFDEECTCKFEFPVEYTGVGVSGYWNEDDDAVIPYRRVMIFEASKLQPIIEKIKKFI